MKKALAILALLTLSAELFADQPRGSNLNIWAESENMYVLHSHSAHAWNVRHSETRIVSKTNGKVIFRGETAPFTALVAVAGGKYFAGLSDLQAGTMPAGYNFALFTPEGKFLSKVYVSSKSGYCQRVRQSVSQSVRWFSQNPEITLEWNEEELVSIRVQSLFSEDEDCVLPPGEHLIEFSAD